MTTDIKDPIENFWSTRRTTLFDQIHLDQCNQTIPELINKSCTTYRNKPAFSNDGHTITWGEVDCLSARLASFLQNHTQLKKGDRVVVQLPNLLQHPIICLGVIRGGFILVNANPMYTPTETIHMLQDSGAKAWFPLASDKKTTQKVLAEIEVPHVIYSSPKDFHPKGKSLASDDLLYALEKGEEFPYLEPSLSPENTAVLQYTGGTTGVSKGAVLSHRNLVTNLVQVHESFPETTMGNGNETQMTPLPLYHIYSFTCCTLLCMYSGNHSVLITNPSDIKGFIAELKKWPFTGFTGLNTLFVALCSDPDFKDVDFSHLKYTTAGGMAVTRDAAQNWQKITGSTVAEGYGLTETSPVLTMNHQDDIRQGTIGRPMPLTSIKLVDNDGNDIPLGKGDQRGEICAKGPQVMSGYWQNPEANQKSFLQNNWFRTGDIGTIDKDGFIKIVDRKKDMILVSGFNVFPGELENALCDHAQVNECAAIGTPDPRSGEVVSMYVVRNNPELTSEEVKGFLRSRLTSYKIPKHVHFVEDLPKSPVGKILRRELRESVNDLQ